MLLHILIHDGFFQKDFGQVWAIKLRTSRNLFSFNTLFFDENKDEHTTLKLSNIDFKKENKRFINVIIELLRIIYLINKLIFKIVKFLALYFK